MELIEKTLWVEKYRPKKLEDMVLKDEERKLMTEWISKKEFPHILFVGKPGSGKSTLARILVDSVCCDKEADLLELNGSTSRGIDVVRNQIEDFLKSMIFSESKIKIVYIDEADQLTNEAQMALKNMIEKYSSIGRFIFTANYESKFDEAIISRFQVFRFKELSKEYIKDFIKKILDSEQIQYNDNSLDKIISTFHPDIRKIIGTIERKCVDKKLSTSFEDMESNEKLCHSLFNDLVKAILTKNGLLEQQSIQKTQNLLKENDLDYRSLYEEIFDDTSTPAWAARVINMYQCKHMDAMIPRLNYISMLFKLIEVGTKFRDI